MSLLPKIRAKFGEGVGVELFFAFPENQDDPRSYLDADSLAGDNSLTANGNDFAVNQFIVLGQAGNQKTEILRISGVTSTTISLASPAVYPHNRGDVIRFIPYDQLVPERSTDNGTTFSALSTVTLRPDATETYLQRTGDASTDVYRFRFQNSFSSLFSQYSDTVTASGYADNTIWSVKNRALREMGEVRSALITDQDLNDWLQEARRLADQNPAVLRWSFRTKFNNVTGMLLAGQWKIKIPTDLRDPNSFKNVLSIRCANQNRPVVYQDRVRFNQNYLNVSHSTVSVQQTSGGITLQLASTADFDPAGAVTLSNNSVGDGLIIVNYTANNKTTNTLSGVSGINRTVLVGTEAWQRAVYGLPTGYTVGGDGYWYFDVPLKIDYDGMNIKDDHYTIIPAISTDDQTFDEPFYDLYVSFLKWRIKYKKANGRLDRDGDPDYKDWLTGLAELIGQEVPGQRINFIPDIEGFLSATE